MYQHVQHQVSLKKLAVLCEDFFHLPVNQAYVHRMKTLLAEYYRPTTRLLMKRLLAGKVIHIDETEIGLKHGKGYVWVLTNHEEVVYIYRPNREAGFLKELLAGFQGVVVSDFYAGYDGLACRQQKCLIHLIRDMNTDLRLNPFDDELRTLIGEFAKLVRRIVDAIDRHGLKADWLGKHKPQVEGFLNRVCGADYRSQVAQGYKERFTKYRERLFTFLNYDGVPWNNNDAEYAIKQFAQYRALIDGNIEESGLDAFLALLSICVTCKYKGLSFLRFLLSQERDIDAFAQGRAIKKQRHRLELYPKGYPRGHNRQPRLSKAGIEGAADKIGVGHLYRPLMTALKGFSTEVHPTVANVAFAGVFGKKGKRLTIITLRLDESDSGRGLRYAVCLGRFSKYFGIAMAKMRKAFPAYEKVDQHDGRTGECGAGYFRDAAEVEKFLAVINNESQRPPIRRRKQVTSIMSQ